jgi:hypothetical protein
MSPQNQYPQPIQVTNWIDPTSITTGTTQLTNQYLPMQQTAPPVERPRPKPEPGTIPGRKAGDAFRRLGKIVADVYHEREEKRQKWIAENHLPLIQGAARETEIEKRVEHKKKITLERTVGITRDKGSGDTATHTGTLTLVRTMEGTPPQMDQVGLKTEGGSGGYVEIPIDELRNALDELESQNGNGDGS